MFATPLKLAPRHAVVAGLALVAVAVVGTFAVQRLASRAGTALQSGVVGNAAPSVDAVVPSDASGSGSVALPAAGFTLNEGATRDLYVRGTVSDPNGCSDVSGVNLTVYRPGVAYGGTDGMDANGVLGQGTLTSFTTRSNPTPPTSSSVNFVHDVAVDTIGRRVFVPDQGNSRILVFDTDETGIPLDAVADHVLGQANFTDNLANRGGGAIAAANTMKYPTAVLWEAESSRLFVSDEANNRVLVFDLSSGITTDMGAYRVLGQVDFSATTANRGGSAAVNSLKAPKRMAWDGADKILFLADTSNHRVLTFDLVATLTNGMDASHVLGQADFNGASSFRGGSASSDSLSIPMGLAWDAGSSRFFVSGDNRTLVFGLSSGVIDGMAASHVLGQADFSHVGANRDGAVADDTLSLANGATWDAGASRLFVVDGSNNRVLAYDLAAGITDGMAASHVLGQEDFVSSGLNRGGSPAANTLRSPTSVSWDATHNRLWVSESGNHRVLWYNLDAGAACTPDANNCYTAAVAKAALVGCSGAGDTDATFEATIPVANFADPTDAGSPYDFQAWRADAVVADAATLAGSLSADFEVQSLAAFTVSPSLMDYGTIALGATSAQQALTVTNTGNRSVNSYVRADGDMHSSLAGFADIASAQTHYSVSQAMPWSAGTPVAATDTDLPLALPQQTADAGPIPEASAFFYLKLPTTGVRGTYTNTLYFTAYAP